MLFLAKTRTFASHIIVLVATIELTVLVAYDGFVPKIIKDCCHWLSRKLNNLANLAAENLALNQQLIVLERNQNRPKLTERDRLF